MAYCLAYCAVGMDIRTTTHSCTTCHSLGHLQFLDIALNDLSDVYSASVSFMDSTDNLSMEERAAT